jgi:hypothetical protein
MSVQLCCSYKANAHGIVSPILKLSTKALLTRPTWAIIVTEKRRRARSATASGGLTERV